jgi:hypothetical protein
MANFAKGSTSLNFYRPSGFFDAKALILVPFGMAIISSFFALPYAKFLWYSPVIYVSVLAPAVFALVASLLSRWTVKKSRLRSPQLANCLGGAGAVVGFYFSWAAWAVLYENATGHGTLNLLVWTFTVTESSASYAQVVVQALHPLEIWDKIAKAYEIGLWSVEGRAIHGLILAAIWILEAAIYFFVVTRLFGSIAGAPFSERLYRWFPKNSLSSNLALPPKKDPIAAFEAIKVGQFGALLEAREERSPESSSYLKVDLYYLPKAGDAFATIYGYALKPNGRSHKKSLLAKYVKIHEILGKTLTERFG